MAGSVWQPPGGAEASQLLLWAQRLMRLFDQGKHKDYQLVSVSLTAGTTTVVSADYVTSASKIFLQPSSSAAAALSPYISARSYGTGFTLTHGAAAGGETYDCLVIR